MCPLSLVTGVVLEGHLLVELVHMLPYPPMFKGVSNLAEVQPASCARTHPETLRYDVANMVIPSEIGFLNFPPWWIHAHQGIWFRYVHFFAGPAAFWSSLLDDLLCSMVWPRILLWMGQTLESDVAFQHFFAVLGVVEIYASTFKSCGNMCRLLLPHVLVHCMHTYLYIYICIFIYL